MTALATVILASLNLTFGFIHTLWSSLWVCDSTRC